MMTVFQTSANAVLPIVLLIVLGYFLKRIGFLTPEFLKNGNKFVFRVALPCMLFCNVYDIPSFSSIRFDAVFYSLAVVLLIFSVGLLSVLLLVREPKRRGVVLQCAFRSNFAIIGLALAAAIGNAQSQSVAAILSAFTIPLFNVLAVTSLSVFVGGADKKRASFSSVMKNIAKNPLILGIAAGFVCLLLRTLQNEAFGETVFSLAEDVPFLDSAFRSIKAMAAPLALIVLGGQFEFSAVKGLKREILLGTSMRLLIAPILGVGGAILFNKLGILSFGVDVYPALVALFGSPVAASSAIMAAEMKNDGQLATQLMVWTSIFSIATIFLTVSVLTGMGILNS